MSPTGEKPPGPAKDDRPWWKRMKRETGKVKDPYGGEVDGVKWSVEGDGFLAEVIQGLKRFFGGGRK